MGEDYKYKDDPEQWNEAFCLALLRYFDETGKESIEVWSDNGPIATVTPELVRKMYRIQAARLADR